MYTLDFANFLQIKVQQAILTEHLPKYANKMFKIATVKYQNVEEITNTHRFKTLRSFNSFLKRLSKLDTTAILTVSQLVMLVKTNFKECS